MACGGDVIKPQVEWFDLPVGLGMFVLASGLLPRFHGTAPVHSTCELPVVPGGPEQEVPDPTDSGHLRQSFSSLAVPVCPGAAGSTRVHVSPTSRTYVWRACRWRCAMCRYVNE